MTFTREDRKLQPNDEVNRLVDRHRGCSRRNIRVAMSFKTCPNSAILFPLQSHTIALVSRIEIVSPRKAAADVPNLDDTLATRKTTPEKIIAMHRKNLEIALDSDALRRSEIIHSDPLDVGSRRYFAFSKIAGLKTPYRINSRV